MRHTCRRAATLLSLTLMLTSAISGAYGQDKPEAPQPQSQPAVGTAASQQVSGSSQAVEISLGKAIELARANSTVYSAALTEAASAHEDRTQARDALLPQVAYNNQYLYTQANELGQVRFIANNAV